MKKNILLMILFFVVIIDSYGVIRYVKPTASGTGDGSTWANASADIQGMIVASLSGDEVWVATGLYKPLKDGAGSTTPSNVQNKVFWLKSGIKLYGGFDGTETLVSQRNIITNKTIFSGDIDNNDINIDGNNIAEVSSDIQGTNVYQLLVLNNCDKTTIVDGIILTAAQGINTISGSGQTINGVTTYPYYGSGIFMSFSFPLIKNCILSGNNSFFGVAFHTVTSPISVVYNDSVKVVSTVFTGNTSKQGGAMYMLSGHSYLNNVVMYNNNATSGGAVFISNSMAATDKITIVNSTFVNNYSTSNTAFFIQQGTVKFYNDIIHNATSPTNGNILKSGPATITSSYSILQNSKNSGIWNNFYGTDGGNNYDANPTFFNISSPAGADGNYFTADDGLSLTNCSPAVNSGTNYIVGTYPSVINYDILGNTRPFSSGIADMGAYEFQGASTRPDNAINQQSSTYSITCGQSVNLSATCTSGTVTWYTALGGGSSIGTGSPLNIYPISNPATYYAACESGSNCVSLNRAAVNSIAVTLPADPSSVMASNTLICTNTQVTLSASCIAPASPEWYNGASIIGTGTSMVVTVPFTTTYTVKCKDGICFSNIGTVLVNVLSTPTANIRPTMFCLGQQATLTASCSAGTVQWFDAPTGGNMVGTGSPLIITPTYTIAGYYRYYPSCTNGTCSSDIAYPNFFILFAPPISVAVSQTSICPSTSISLSADCSALPLGSFARWYDTPTGGTLLGTGSPFSRTPTVTTTYYVECFNNTPNCATPRVATQQVVVRPVTSNLNLTANISGMSIQASSNTIVATNSILTGANVQYLANNSITLLPQSGAGFQTNNGAVFEAKIMPLTTCN